MKIQEKHSRAIRWMHWINFPLLALMVWSGILIYWANEAYVSIPKPVSQFLGIHHHLALGIAWHFFLAWVLTLNGLAYLIFLIFSGEWREITPTRKSLYHSVLVVLHELHLRKTLPEPEGKYNAAQKLAYFSALLMGIGAVLSGLAIYKPIQLGWLKQLLGGYEAARLEHFFLMIGLSSFFIIHVIQVIRAGWNNFRSMLAGYEIVGEKNDPRSRFKSS